ncbi:transcriptional regulator TdcA, partial [Klebsiella pneumoniae]
VTIPIKEALPVARYAAVWSKNYRLKTAAASLVEMAKHYSSGQGNRHWQPLQIIA